MEGQAVAGGALRAALNYWAEFVARCIAQRLETDRFEAYVKLVHPKHPLPPSAIADFFLRPQPSNRDSLDPRIPPYLQVLTQLGYVDTPSILRALFKYSSSHAQAKSLPQEPQDQAQTDGSDEQNDKDKASKAPITRWESSYWAEEVIFYSLTKLVVQGKAIPDSRTALDVGRVISKWMALFTSASTAFAADVMEHLQTSKAREDMESARAALVALLMRLCENEVLVKAVGKPFAKDIRKELSTSLASFVPTLQPVPEITEKLELFRTETLANLEPGDKKKPASNTAMDDLLESTVGLDNFVVAEIPIANTRAGLYIYLNACLTARPLIDDHALFSYMNNRCPGDVQSSAIELIIASFDILANAVFRNEGQKDAHLLRSYLINKVPLLLCQLCPPEYSGASAEFCITQALSHVDTSIFPTASLMFDESRNNNPYTESVREEFCAACVLHGLVQREHVERILGEMSMSYEPSLEKYSKEKLVQNCLPDTDKIQGLVRELDKMDGNVGAVCQALVEILRQLCINKETMSLKIICGQLAQKPQSLDVILLFEKLPTILEPLCTLLDNWSDEEDQGEYQPVYEEFGSILLLVMAFTYRYDLSPADIGIQSPDSGVSKILNRAHVDRRNEELTEQENVHMNGWILGLFDTEGGGLSDELMSSCPPQDFYLLVATLFQSMVVAYTYGHLNDESLKGGIEYLVDTFLLPSLVPAIRFLGKYLWIDQKEQKSIIKILQLILLPSSISGEASTMLSSVKNLIAKPLEHALRVYQRRDPRNEDIEPLLRALRDSIPLSRRTGGADHNELQSWSTTLPNAMSSAIRHTMSNLTQWSLHPELNMPTSYTHRQVIAALNYMGPKRLLHSILEELRQQGETSSVSFVYDVATAMICAPDTDKDRQANMAMLDANGNILPPMQRVRTLRELVKVMAEDCKKIQKTDPVLAEIVVRLHRRVEAQMVMPQVQVMLQAADMSLNLNDQAAGLEDAMAAAAGAQGDSMSVDTMGLDMGMGGVASDLGLGGSVVSGGGLDTSGDADMFGGLDTGDMVDFEWAGMDLQ
ncbi:mediator complex, subunit Med5 [Dactylonectria macrodidyma]|uniref:Mediator of RNA polymerase II transcription subunit 5 n=1 Tax=Dactylonectria macrodidyma TaxID=307937 RepID=A0A9P9JN60_9HYPO|nr:mediator complex, subunit Med5 [Dactylonectria macrodidyma]